jgi:hypothetical protein
MNFELRSKFIKEMRREIMLCKTSYLVSSRREKT